MVSTPGIFSLFSELKENVLKESCAPKNNTRLDLIQLLLLGPKKWIYLTFVWIKICICWFSGQSLSSSEGDDIAWKQKPKENQKRKKKGKNIIDSGNVLGWTWTDFEALHKLLHLLVVMLYSVLVNSQCDLHHYENIVLKDSHNYMYNIKIITWPYIWINLTSARLWWRSFSFNNKVCDLLLEFGSILYSCS